MAQVASMPNDPESSIDLLLKAQAGNAQALDRLLARYLPRLLRWATGRMPVGIRSMNDTCDIVQEAVIKALPHLPALEIKSEGALQAYLRTAIDHRITDQYRRHQRHPHDEIPPDTPAEDTTPLDAAIGAEAVASYDRGLAALSPEDRQLIVLSVELDLSYAEIAQQTGKPSVDAARMAVTRALKRLSAAMGRGL